MAEGLGEVAEELSRGLVHLLGEQPDVVGVTDAPLEHFPGPIDLPGQGQGLRQPERAQEERPFLAGQPVHVDFGAVPVHQSALVGEPLLGDLDGREHPRIVRG